MCGGVVEYLEDPVGNCPLPCVEPVERLWVTSKNPPYHAQFHMNRLWMKVFKDISTLEMF